MKHFLDGEPLESSLRLVTDLQNGEYTYSLEKGRRRSGVNSARINATDLGALSIEDCAKAEIGIADSLDAWVTAVDGSDRQINVIHITYNISQGQAWRAVAIACRAARALNVARDRADKRRLGFAFSGFRKRSPEPEVDYSRANGAGAGSALAWLRDHQNRDGHWSATGFGSDSTRTDAVTTYIREFRRVNLPGADTGWKDTVDVGLTGLALTSFAVAGYDHRSGDYKETCRRALLYLRKVQTNDGCFGAQENDHFVYNHAACTMAVAEMWGLTMDRVLKPVLRKAVEFILNAQNPGLGWRYGVRPGINDTSVTGWMVLALKSSEVAGLDLDFTEAYAGVASWLTTVTADFNGHPKVGYDSPASNNSRLRTATEFENNPAMDATYIYAMLFAGKADLEDETIQKLAKTCTRKENLPTWEDLKIDFCYWYYGSLAIYYFGGSHWKKWDKAVADTLLNHQRGFHALDKARGLTTAEVLDEHGSWDPVGAWGTAGGRVHSTAMGCLTLQIHERYRRLND